MGFIESERPRECVNFAIIWRSADVLNLSHFTAARICVINGWEVLEIYIYRLEW